MDPNDPWSMPPPTTGGDSDSNITYAAVGRALSQWERFEAHLALIFVRVIGVDHESVAARRAYGVIASFSGRADMLKAAATMYFLEHPSPELQTEFTRIWNLARRASPRRNDIAHGIVQPMGAVRSGKRNFALYPAYYNSNRRDDAFKPDYVYSAEEIDRFGRQFNELCEPAQELIGDLSDRHSS